MMKGSHIMFYGSFVLLLLCAVTPKEYFYHVIISFFVIELVLAFYFSWRNHKKRVDKSG